MAAIEVGNISFDEIRRGDMLDVSFDVEHDLDLTGKTLYAEVRRRMDEDPVLIFAEGDSLTVTHTTPTTFTLRFQKSSTEMDLPLNTYQIAIVMSTPPDYEDKQTIIEGAFTVIEEITQKPASWQL